MDIPADGNCSVIKHNLTNVTCFEFSDTSYHIAVWMRTGLSSLAALLSFLAILFMVFSSTYMCTCKRKDFVNRLVLYLCIAAFCNGVITALQLLPVHQMCGHVFLKSPEGCIAAAFIIQYSLWTILVLTILIGIYLFFRVKHYQDYEDAQYDNNFENSRCFEGVTLVLAFVVVPALFSTVPFYTGKSHMYGLSGAWCWIKTTDKYCHEIKSGFIEQFVVWYGFNVLLVILFICDMIVIAFMIMRKKATAADRSQGKYCRALKAMCPLITYPAVFSLIYSFGVVNRIYYARTKNTVEWLWITNGIADTLIALIVPLAFFLNRLCKTNCCGYPNEDDGVENDQLIQ